MEVIINYLFIYLFGRVVVGGAPYSYILPREKPKQFVPLLWLDTTAQGLTRDTFPLNMCEYNV